MGWGGEGGTEELRDLKTLHCKRGHDSVGQLGTDSGMATLCLQLGVAWKEAGALQGITKFCTSPNTFFTT